MIDGTVIQFWVKGTWRLTDALWTVSLDVDIFADAYCLGWGRGSEAKSDEWLLQIALRNGCPQDWGLVEFIGEEDAERTAQNLDGYTLHGHRIRVAYYIPGVRAINLYLKLLNDGVSH